LESGTAYWAESAVKPERKTFPFILQLSSFSFQINRGKNKRAIPFRKWLFGVSKPFRSYF